MLETKDVINNEDFVLYETGRDYDGVAVIMNKTDKPLVFGKSENPDDLEVSSEVARLVVNEDAIGYQFTVDANDYIGLTAREYLEVRTYFGFETMDTLEEYYSKRAEEEEKSFEEARLRDKARQMVNA